MVTFMQKKSIKDNKSVKRFLISSHWSHGTWLTTILATWDIFYYVWPLWPEGNHNYFFYIFILSNTCIVCDHCGLEQDSFHLSGLWGCVLWSTTTVANWAMFYYVWPMQPERNPIYVLVFKNILKACGHLNNILQCVTIVA